MNVVTARFGEIEVDESKIINMQGGIIGFEHLKKYILHMQDEKNPFWWYQSLDDGKIAFVVINPFIAKADYEPVISDNDIKFLEIKGPDDVVLLAIVTILQNPFSVSANLRAPIVINAEKRIAKQIILEDQTYPVKYYLTTGPADEAAATGDSEKPNNCKTASL
ncbi:MAG TPA: flagellar assembly protein FliW [Syntrophales bacterium]|nr:flagellar assembly protein FliW [Syntrophales bacterium]